MILVAQEKIEKTEASLRKCLEVAAPFERTGEAVDNCVKKSDAKTPNADDKVLNAAENGPKEDDQSNTGGLKSNDNDTTTAKKESATGESVGDEKQPQLPPASATSESVGDEKQPPLPLALPRDEADKVVAACEAAWAEALIAANNAKMWAPLICLGKKYVSRRLTCHQVRHTIKLIISEESIWMNNNSSYKRN